VKRSVVVLLAATAVTACAGEPDSVTARADRTVVITMRDNHFEPDDVDVDVDETIAFRFVNRGKNRHDAFFGDADAQAAHEEEMRANDDGGHDAHMSEGTGAAIVEPGKSATIVRTFDRGPNVLIGCHEPGHYEDGMIATINVA
jgi:uncharacterized cupredoxin-like copper-binding protein